MSTVVYAPLDGGEVSREWGVVLADMRQAGVRFFIREGHRTYARQMYFWLLMRSGRGNRAAYPSPVAPHIRTGRIDHAIDVSNDQAVMAWLTSHGLAARRTVRGESWHIEVPAHDLVAYYARHHRGPADPIIRPYYMRPFRPNDRAAVLKLQKLLRALNLRCPLDGRYRVETRAAVARFQRKQNLKPDRIVGATTWKSLRKASG